MITLGIDTSLSAVSFAIVENTTVLAEFNNDVGRNLADKIGDIITDLFNKADISVREIDRCGIVVGPGSFTGLRIGIAFAKGLFADSDVKIAAISSLECCAESCGKSAGINVVFDARQDEVFYALFEKNKENAIGISDEKRISFDDVIENLDENSCVVYSLSGNSDSPIKKLFSNFECVEAETLSNRGAVAAKIALKSENLQTIDEVFPNYMQVSYAERMIKERREKK